MKSKIEKLRGSLQAKKERDIAEAREKARQAHGERCGALASHPQCRYPHENSGGFLGAR